MGRFNTKANLGCVFAFAAVFALVYLADYIAGNFFRNLTAIQP